eukprot:s143_g13.t1
MATIDTASGEIMHSLDQAEALGDAHLENKDAANLLGADKDFGSSFWKADDMLKDGNAANGEKEEIHEMPEVVKQQLEDAAEARENLVIQWREVCKPRRAGAIAAKRRGSRKDFADLFQQWLIARNLNDALVPDRYESGWKVYKYDRTPVVKSEEHWARAFHGTWWYSVWLVLESGVFLESNDRDKGHDFWEPGVYCSPNLSTARWYARPHILFGDGVYHRVIFELRVNEEKRIRNRQRGGVQWVFKPDAVSLYAVWVQRNAPPANGEERINDWDPKLEARPPGKEVIDATRSWRCSDETNHWDLEFSETEDDEPGEKEPEDQPVAPHLHASQPWPKSASPVPSSAPPMIPAAHRTGATFSRRHGHGGHGHGVVPPAPNGNIYAQQSVRAVNGAYLEQSALAAPRNGRAMMSHGSSFVPGPRPGKTDWAPKSWQNGEAKARHTPRKRFQQPKKRKAEEMEKKEEEEKKTENIDDDEGFEAYLKRLDQERKEKEEKAEKEKEAGLCAVAPLKLPHTLKFHNQ